MVHPAWKDYPKEVRASEWHRLPWLGDARATLTWKGRLESVIKNGGVTQVYNFYSSGEEVLNNPGLDNPNLDTSDPFNNGNLPWTTPNKMWAMQEKRKGLGLSGYIHTSNYGGWLINLTPYRSHIHIPTTVTETQDGAYRLRRPSELPTSGSEHIHFLDRLIADPMFDNSEPNVIFDNNIGINSPGSQYAIAHRNTLISEMIPCTTFATGRNKLINEQKIPADRNVDMDKTMKADPNEWPESNANGVVAVDENGNPITNRPWLHSDIREKAFTHTWPLFEKFVGLGNFKSQP